MKTKTVYQCEYCLSEYTTTGQAYKCEADCLKLTWDEYTEYMHLLTREKQASSIVSITSNEKTRKFFNDCVNDVIAFQKEHGITDSKW